MYILQGTIAACLVALISAEPPVGNEYLPPSSNGYNYPAPQVPFPPPQRPPSSPPSTPSYKPPSYPSPPPNRPPPTYGPPASAQKPTYGPPISSGNQNNYETAHLNQPHVPGMPYDFNYAVKDDYYGTDYSHNAVSDGDQVKGEYRVQLPDGRLQIVSYVADWATGFHADVRYEGQASYPEANKGGYPAAGPPAAAYGPPSSGY